MTGGQTLLLLRLAELAYMMIALWWILHSPPSRLRTLRLYACWSLVGLNITAILVATFWLKITLW